MFAPRVSCPGIFLQSCLCSPSFIQVGSFAQACFCQFGRLPIIFWDHSLSSLKLAFCFSTCLLVGQPFGSPLDSHSTTCRHTYTIHPSHAKIYRCTHTSTATMQYTVYNLLFTVLLDSSLGQSVFVPVAAEYSPLTDHLSTQQPSRGFGLCVCACGTAVE